jgi:DNA repair protein RAD50
VLAFSLVLPWQPTRTQAVLDNVIFVHQEDSNWPLADGATLKKKFDEIFSATKYTKFLENVRKIRLEKAQQAKELKLQLETLRAHKDAAHKLRTAAASGTHKAEQQEAQRAELEQQHEVLMAEIAALDAALERISETDEQAAKVRSCVRGA